SAVAAIRGREAARTLTKQSSEIPVGLPGSNIGAGGLVATASLGSRLRCTLRPRPHRRGDTAIRYHRAPAHDGAPGAARRVAAARPSCATNGEPPPVPRRGRGARTPLRPARRPTLAHRRVGLGHARELTR